MNSEIVCFLFVCFWPCGFDMFYWRFIIRICKGIVNQVRSVEQIVLWWSESYQWTVHCIVPDGKINLLRTQLTVWANALRFHPAPENKQVNVWFFFWHFCLFAVSHQTQEDGCLSVFCNQREWCQLKWFPIWKNAGNKNDTGAATFRWRKLVQSWTLVSIQAKLSRNCC